MSMFVTGTKMGEIKLWDSEKLFNLGTLNTATYNPSRVLQHIVNAAEAIGEKIVLTSDSESMNNSLSELDESNESLCSLDSDDSDF